MPWVPSARSPRHSGDIPGQTLWQAAPNIAEPLPLSMKVTPSGRLSLEQSPPGSDEHAITDRADVGDPMLVTVNGSGEKGAPTAAQVAVSRLVITGAPGPPTTFRVKVWVASDS